MIGMKLIQLQRAILLEAAFAAFWGDKYTSYDHPRKAETYRRNFAANSAIARAKRELEKKFNGPA